MASLEPGYQDAEAGSADEPGFPPELWSLLKTISHQIDEADQRHTGLLQEMRDRLAMLSRDAEDARGSVPDSVAPAFGRMESSLADLAQRIDDLNSAPAALKSAVGPAAQLSDDRAALAGSIDPFDVVGADDNEEHPWQASDAEALTKVYEETDAALVGRSPRSPISERDMSFASDPRLPAAAAAVHAQPVPFPQEDLGGLGATSLDRQWLDHRLGEIAIRIEQSLADLRPDLALEGLGVRFDAFEERMGNVLGDVATRNDVENLRLLESQIQDLALHLEQTERQLGRLDGIEQQLQAVIDHLTDEFAEPGRGHLSEAPSIDFKLLASSTAEEVAERFAASMRGNGPDHRIDELGSLLRSMIHDRRQSDEQTFTMLDTVQQAMIRLLDRIDALEATQSQAEVRRVVAQDAGADPALRNIREEFQDFGAPDHVDGLTNMAPVYKAGPAAHAVPPLPPTHAAAGVSEQSASDSPIEKLRQEFVADAQRAKLRAAASTSAVEDVAPGAVPAQGTSRAARPRGPAQPAGVTSSDIAAENGSARKQRLTALVLCLVIAVSGSALFLKSRTKAPAPASVPAVTEIMKETQVPKTAAAVDDATEVEQPEIDVPAAPKSQAAPPSVTGQGGQFEVPPEAAVPVPAPVPPNAIEPSAPVAPQLAPGVSGPQTNEGALGLDGEALSGGELLENRPDAQNETEGRGLTPQGIILQNGERVPSAQEFARLQTQQSTAALSSRLGSKASQLTPADLMPEEVARHAAPAVADTRLLPQTASLSMTEASSQHQNNAPVAGAMTATQLSLPPATVGPLSLRMAAANGDPSAAFEVGARLAEGKGTPQNFQEAVFWYQKSAAQGFAQAQYRLGTLYERGLGVKTDLPRAQIWYQQAAAQGHVKAMHNLAVLSAGRATGNPDYATAALWFEKAAEHGLADSQFNLAVLHENGLGVAKDPVRAFKWYQLAARAGDGEALRRRDQLKSQLTAQQRLDAEGEVAAFVPQRSPPLINDARVAGEDWKKRQDS